MLMDVLVTGIPAGCLYALVAVGFNILYRPTNVFNFAQGDLVMLGAMLIATLQGYGWLPWPVALTLVMVLVGLVTAIIERVAVFPVLRHSPHSHAWVITTLAVSMILTNVVGKIWGSDPLSVPPPTGLSTEPMVLGDLLISSYQIALVIFTIALVAGIEALYQTRTGRAIMAVAENREAALLRGIDPSRLSLWSFFIGGGLAALTGYLAAPILFASTSLGGALLLKGFAAAAVGGLGSNKGALGAGLLIGVTESVSANFFSSGYQDAIILVVVLAILMLRPQGLFGNVKSRAV
jgi:branched-chain amino acid transport system permease protein